MAANTSGKITTIDNSSLNGQSSQIVLATVNWNPGGTSGIYNPQTTSIGSFVSSFVLLRDGFED